MLEKQVYIFDLDNTLIDTQAKVKVLDKNGRLMCYLDSVAYNHMEKSLGGNVERAQLDYSQFRTLKFLMSEPKTSIFERMRKAYNEGNYIYILTTRPTQHMVYKWMVKNKIYIDKRNVLCFNEKKYPSVAEYKKAKLNDIVNSYPSHTYINVYEDDESYMNAMKEVDISGNEYIVYHKVEKNYYGHFTTLRTRSQAQIQASIMKQLNNGKIQIQIAPATQGEEI